MPRSMFVKLVLPLGAAVVLLAGCGGTATTATTAEPSTSAQVASATSAPSPSPTPVSICDLLTAAEADALVKGVGDRPKVLEGPSNPTCQWGTSGPGDKIRLQLQPVQRWLAGMPSFMTSDLAKQLGLSTEAERIVDQAVKDLEAGRSVDDERACAVFQALNQSDGVKVRYGPAAGSFELAVATTCRNGILVDLQVVDSEIERGAEFEKRLGTAIDAIYIQAAGVFA